MSLHCRQCNGALDPTQTFCPRCGHRADRAVVVPRAPGRTSRAPAFSANQRGYLQELRD